MKEKDTNSEAWRMECEARYVARMRKLADRRAYLEAVEGRRGIVGRKALEREINEQWQKRVRKDED
ncbi:hypothetical protein E6Q11_00070 [Candidatus Dojkabacteria bacterium]|uniref:Uncharacterized protein n=1 Tax=Candidatus Dojkabacteria bacterium TaxID=2099670 RepID=A0A5C7JBT4_9BACT|nr:MAG: hypothetical protein E6Q11_00070 [Candidatus Dojkabacteria bacterium]